MVKIAVTLSDDIITTLRDIKKLGNTDSARIRSVVISWLSEHKNF